MESKLIGELQSFYIAVILYESSSDAPQYTPLYQECFVLIKAGSLEEAHRKALAHAEAENVSYLNEKGETITWSLRQIVDVNPVLNEHLEDITELYVRHFRNYDAYRQFEEISREGREFEVGKPT